MVGYEKSIGTLHLSTSKIKTGAQNDPYMKTSLYNASEKKNTKATAFSILVFISTTFLQSNVDLIHANISGFAFVLSQWSCNSSYISKA